MKPKINPATEMELAFAAGEFRKELDALLKKHGAKMQIGWEGKWAYFQVVFPRITNSLAATMIKTRKGDGACRYLNEDSEDYYEFVKSPVPVGILLAAGHDLCPLCERARTQEPQLRREQASGGHAEPTDIDPSICG